MTDLAIGLSAADAAALTVVAREVAAAEVEVRRAEARRVRALADAHRLAERIGAGAGSSKTADMARRTVASEIAVPLRLNDRAVQQQMGDAFTVVDGYPQTVAAWAAGRISRGHVRVVETAGAGLDTRERRLLDTVAVRVCDRETAGRAKTVVGQLAEQLHPRTLTDRHRDARAHRQVWVAVLGDGMSRLTADIPTILGEGIHDRLTRQAIALLDARDAAKERVRNARAAGMDDANLDPSDIMLASDARTREQIRADILCDLLLTGGPAVDPTGRADGHGELGGIRAHVQVVMPVTALLGGDQPADLTGSSPIDAATARKLAGNAPGVDRILTHPVTGQVLATDRYEPTPDLRRRLRARDRHCRFPGCRIPAIRCEHDHTIDHALGGETRLENLAGLCQRHHSMKQFTPWQVKQLGDGILEWTSPTGRVYTDHPPPPTVFFSPDDGPPPPF